MRSFTLLSLSLLAAAPTARGLAQDPQPSRVLPAAANAGSFRLPGAGEAPLVEVRADGTIWAGAESYKAGFDRRGATFVPFLGSDAAHDWPATFRATRVTVGGKDLACAEASPVRVEGAVQFARGGVIERYLLRGEGLEQTFGFETLPERGEIVVTVGVDTQLEVAAFGDGHRFTGPNGGLEYGAATAIDALGKSLPLQTRWTGHGFEITVPESFAAAAALPLWIDPFVYASHSYGSSPRELRTPDIAWDTTLNRGAICWERVFSATDRDVYVSFCETVMTQIGTVQIIDFSTDDWHGPRIAGLEDPDVRLVVAQVEAASGAPSAVFARRVTGTNDPVVDPVFLVAANAMNPDVGGSRVQFDAVPFLVVFERIFSASDHDIVAQRVDSGGALLGTTILIDNSTAFEERPEISKTFGDGSSAVSAWAIAYRRRTASNTGDMYVSFCNPQGAVRTVNNNHSFRVQSAVALGDLTWAISSPTRPTLGSSQLFAMQLQNPGGGIQLRFMLISSTGTILAATTRTSFIYDFGRLDVDSDGCRFAMAYETLDLSTAAPIEARVETFALTGNVLSSQDLASLPAAQNLHRAPRLAAKKDGIDSQYAVVWAETPAASTWQITGITYAGHRAGNLLSIRSTACGPTYVYATLNVGSYLGGQVSLDASQGNNGFVGWFAGLPANTPLPICPGCTLGTDMMVVLSGATHIFSVPCDGNLVGGVIAFQPFLVALPLPGLCLGNIALGDSFDVAIL